MTASTDATPGAARPSRPTSRTPLWAKILLVLVILVAIAAAAVGGIALGRFFGAQESRDTQVIRSIKGEEQVVLLTAGMTDVKEQKADGLKLAIGALQLFTLPGTERSLLVRYEYDAKFGIEGKDVDIQSTGNDLYLVTIPKFIYLGYANPDLSVAGEKNGALSWTTPEIDKSAVFEQILTDQVVNEHIDGFRPVLQEQAKTFYTRIVNAIDPAVQLQFEFTS